MSLHLLPGKLLNFSKNIKHPEGEIFIETCDYEVGEPVDEDTYHILMMEYGSYIDRNTEITMNNECRLLDPSTYISNLLNSKFDGVGLIMRKTANSSPTFNYYAQTIENICAYANKMKDNLRERLAKNEAS